MNNQQMLSVAIRLAADNFAMELDKGGKPYIMHCLHVMHNVDQSDPEMMCIAVLHDIIEDTNVTPEYLSNMGMSEGVVRGVERMTHLEGETYDDYIGKVSQSLSTIIIKMADIQHNTDVTRLKEVRAKDLARIEKYHRAYLILKEKKEDIESRINYE